MTGDINQRRWLDRLALFVAQPAIAGLALLGLMADPDTTAEVTKPFLIWGGVSLLALIFIEGIWSFGWRKTQSQRLAMLWVKLIGAGVCAVLVFAAAYRHLGVIDTGVETHDAGTAIYFSITAWTTAGLGDVAATPQARPFVAAQTLMGLLFNSALIGLILHATTTMGASDEDGQKTGKTRRNG